MMVLRLAVALCGVAVACVAQSPDRLITPGADEPFWISAQSVTAGGQLDLNALPDIARTVIASRPPGCTVLRSFRHITQKPTATWGDLTMNAEAIYRGTVREVTDGFFSAMPESLLTVHLDSAVRGKNGFPAVGTTVYIDFAAVDFRIGEKRFCTVSPRQDGFVPRAGDEVLIFAFMAPLKGNPRYLPASDEFLLFERGSVLSVPASLRTDPTLPRSFSDMVRDIGNRH